MRAAIGFGLAWLGYSYGLYGYCLVRGYDVRLSDLINPVHPYTWPAGGPPLMPATQIFPTGKKTAATAAAGGGQPGLA
jgi:hypothetical protein